MHEDLKLLEEYIAKVNESNSVLDKKKVIANYDGLGNIFQYVYSPSIQFGVTSDNIKKKLIAPALGQDYNDIFDLLDALADRDITGHCAIASVQKFISNYGFADVIYGILDKDLKTRANAKVINSVFPGLIQFFSPALAYEYAKKKKFVDFKKDDWYASRKLDGCRCLLFLYPNGSVRAFSRKGKEFYTLSVLTQDVQLLGAPGYVLDGEICIVDDFGNESFHDIMKVIKKKDYTIPKPRYKLFDILTLEEFESGTGQVVLTERLKRLNLGSLKTVEQLPQWKIEDESDLERYRATASEAGWEGLIIRKNVGYEGKRSNNLLKVKDFFDDEYVVTDVQRGKLRIIENGVDTERDVVNALIVEHKGNQVPVGTGLVNEQKLYFYEHPEEIIGKTITVQYFEETCTNGKYSLRFPSLKYIYEGERDT